MMEKSSFPPRTRTAGQLWSASSRNKTLFPTHHFAGEGILQAQSILRSTAYTSFTLPSRKVVSTYLWPKHSHHTTTKTQALMQDRSSWQNIIWTLTYWVRFITALVKRIWQSRGTRLSSPFTILMKFCEFFFLMSTSERRDVFCIWKYETE